MSSTKTTVSAQTNKVGAVAQFLGTAKKYNEQELVPVPENLLKVLKKITVVRGNNNLLALDIKTTEGSMKGNLHYSLQRIAEPGDTLVTNKHLSWCETPREDAKGNLYFTFCGDIR